MNQSLVGLVLWVLGVVSITKSYGNETGTLFVIVSALIFIWWNLGGKLTNNNNVPTGSQSRLFPGERQSGEASAYSVFNKGTKGILGSETSFDRETRGLCVDGGVDAPVAAHGT